MSEEFSAVYSRYNNIKSRLNIDDTIKSTIEIHQRDVDDIINRSLRTKLGFTDVNGYEIILPLGGEKNTIDAAAKTVTVAMDGNIQKIADDYVIAHYRKDTAENPERVEQAENDLEQYLNQRFGITLSSVDLDFTTIYPGV